MDIRSKLPGVGTTIFTVMSKMAADHGAINLSQGYPDFDGPEALKARVSHHMAAGHNQYPPMAGVPALREAIAHKVHALYGHDADPEHEITVTSGATEALFDAIMACAHEGDEVIVLDPAYDSYEPAIIMAGATPVHVALQLPGFRLPVDALRAAITPRTRMIVVNSPHNPSATVLRPEDLDDLAALVRDTPILILSDEVYEHIIFDGRAHQSLLRHPDLRQRSFVVSSFGKTYHTTGWKVGYCVAPAALTTEFRKIHQYVTFTTNTPVQMALADFVRDAPEHYLTLPAFYERKRDHFAQLLAGSRFTLAQTEGTYFQLVDYQRISPLPDMEFCTWLTRQVGVAAIPLSPFYRQPPASSLIRLCFCKHDATLEQAAQRLAAL